MNLMAHEQDPIHIVVVAERPGFSEELGRKLHAEGIRIAAEAIDTDEALALARRVTPNVWVLDLDVVRRSKPGRLSDRSNPLCGGKTIVMVTSIEKAHVIEAFRLGARGIVLKSAPVSELVRGIRNVAAGCYWLDGDVLAILVQTLRELLTQANGQMSTTDYGLTPRELDIIAEIVSGRSNREVSQEFSISERTVKHHLTNIFNKLGVSSRLGLALFAVNHQLMGKRGAGAAGPADEGPRNSNGKGTAQLAGFRRLPEAPNLPPEGAAAPPHHNVILRSTAFVCPGK
jgi:two-component system, NarL family, nitrate/nitrite response regulator NarL